MPGSLRVSFAGTYSEAVAFAAQHDGITAPKGLATKGDDDGLPMLCATYKTRAQKTQKRALLTALGWDEEFQIDVPHGNGFSGRAQ